MKEKNSIDIAKASINMAISSRQEEEKLIEEFKKENVLAVAVDIGGNLKIAMFMMVLLQELLEKQ